MQASPRIRILIRDLLPLLAGHRLPLTPERASQRKQKTNE